LPAVGSVVVVAILWKFLFHPLGLVNALLGYVGFERIDWLTSVQTAMLALIIAGIWRLSPYFMVIYLAGLKGLSAEYYEAAALDGANRWQQFRYITLPLLQPTIVLVVIVSVILSLRHFINPMLMTRGGPAGETRVLPLLIYETGFRFSRMGLASAMSMVFFAIMLVFTLIQLHIFRPRD
jgi:multiple sugar transport system permease protein